MSETKGDTYIFEMPWPPTVNHHHQPTIGWKGKKPFAKIVKGAKARQYSKDMTKYLELIGIANKRLSGRLKVDMTLHPMRLGKYDIDNRTKSAFDALSESSFWLDDEQVDILTIEKAEKIEGGLIILAVTVLE